MNKTPLLIIPMMMPLVTANASNLPDEINYPPYQQAYEAAANTVRIISSDLDQAKTELQQAYNLEASITADIQSLEDDIYRTQNIISKNVQERNRLVSLANNLNVDISDTDARLAKAENRRHNLERQYATEDARLEPIRQKVRNLQQKVNQLNNQVNAENGKLKNLKSNLATVTANLKQTQDLIQQLKVKIQEQKQRLANIDAQIKEKQASISDITGKLASAKQTQANEKAKLDALSNEIAELNKKLRTLGDLTSPEAIKIKKQLDVKRQERKSQAAVYTAANTNVEKLKGRLSSEQSALSKLQTQKQSLPAAIAKNEQQLNQSKTKAQSQKQRKDKLTTEVAAQENLVQATVNSANQASNRLSTTKQQLARESVILDDLRVKLTNVNDRIRNLGERLRGLNQDYRVTMNKIDSIDSALPGYRRNLKKLQRDLQLANVDLVNVQDKIIVLNGDVTRLESRLSQATTDRDIRYSDYISRLDYYNQQLTAAKQLGASQTDVALNLARTDSNIAVEEQSQQLGTQMGSELAGAQGAYWSSVRAEIKGYNDGYDIGYASEVDLQRGQQEGTRAGIQAAQNHAQTVLKPEFFNQFFEDALKTEQFKILEQLSYTKIPFSTEEDFKSSEKSVYNVTSAVSPLTTSEVNQSLDIISGLDIKISELKVNLAQVIKQKVSFGKAHNVYQTPGHIPYQTFDCTAVYKGLAVFQNACADEYSAVFKSKYQSEHSANFSAQYNNLYEIVVEETKEQEIGAIYQTNYNNFYPIAKASGISDGKAQIYKETFAIAQENAYNTEIPKATAVTKAEASTEVKSWVASNAALTIKAANIIDSDLRGGSEAKLAIDVKNISPQMTSKPVKMIITETINVKATQKEIYFQNIPGKTITSLKDLKLIVSPEVSSGEMIKISGKMVLPGGKYKTERVETFSATAKAAVNPILAPETLTYDPSPKVKGIRKFKIHRFDIDVTPAVETIPEGYTIELAPMQDADLVTMKVGTSIKTGKLIKGSTKTVSFKYVFKKAAKDKTIPLELKFIFKGKVMKSQIIELKPH